MKIFTFVVASLLMVCGCSKKHPATLQEDLQSKSSAASASVAAGKFLGTLHEQGKLPGVTKGEHGELKSAVPDFSQTVQYPLSVTFRFVKDDGSVCHYTVEQANENSDCKLTKAWRTDANGKTVEEFPVR